MIKLRFVSEVIRDLYCSMGRHARRGETILMICVFAMIGCLSASAQTAPSTRPVDPSQRRWELLSHGSDDRLWYAFTTPAGWAEQPYTFVRDREMQVSEWHELSKFPSRVLAIGESRGQLVASLEGGEWERISAERFASGPRLPGHGDILALAGDEMNPWAIGFAEGARPEAAAIPMTTGAATQPAKSSAVAATKPTGPTTRPEQLQLYKLASENWTRIAALPVDVRTAEAAEIGMVVLHDAPMIAYKDSANVARILRLDRESKTWSPAGSMNAAFAM